MQVVITGGTRGLGLELAKSFLECGDDVLVASRNEATCAAVSAQLKALFPECQVEAVACDVGNAAAVDRVAKHAVKAFNRIDVWINNAAVSAETKLPLSDTAASQYTSIVTTNLLGPMHGAAAALRVMSSQSPPGALPPTG